MQTEMQAYELSTCLLLPAVGKLWLLINALGDKDVPVDSTHMTAVILNVIMSIAIIHPLCDMCTYGRCQPAQLKKLARTYPCVPI